MVQRVTYRRRHCYNTRSNKVKLVKTPGGKLVIQYRKKLGSVPSCGDCGKKLSGIPALRPIEYSRLKKSKRSVSRAYGGYACHTCVRKRIVRAFLVEEQKIVTALRKSKKGNNDADTKETETAASGKKTAAAPAKKTAAAAAGPKKTAAPAKKAAAPAKKN